MEDAAKLSDPPSTPELLRPTSIQNNTNPTSAASEMADSSVTIPLRRLKSKEDKGKEEKKIDSFSKWHSLLIIKVISSSLTTNINFYLIQLYRMLRTSSDNLKQQNVQYIFKYFTHCEVLKYV